MILLQGEKVKRSEKKEETIGYINKKEPEQKSEKDTYMGVKDFNFTNKWVGHNHAATGLAIIPISLPDRPGVAIESKPRQRRTDNRVL
jgi:hypothetical protein